ncbi:MAG: hydrogenase maturation peptidase HycI [Candidatus Omnitrophica bacterium]|nr:hydrogenase maturation peptidase HycI [Candidatus Omnitrophota bacterium]
MSNLSTAEIDSLLKPVVALTVIICVGNTLRSDDGVGPYIASYLKNTGKLAVLDAGYNPENFIEKAAGLRPGRIVIIDAADFGGEPGETRIISERDIPETSLSTHAIPLKVVYHILKEDTGSEIRFIGIQPKEVSHGECLSPEVKAAADNLISKIKKEFSGA